MERKRSTMLINGRLIDIEKISIQELKKIKEELEVKEKNIRARINHELAKENDIE